jgi:c-di-GMP-related signal transduction protein
MSDACVARQPIFDRRLTVVGYELLFRERRATDRGVVDHHSATSTVVLNALTEIGLQRIVGSHLAWINASREFLISGLVSTISPELIGVEILEGQVIDDELIGLVADLKRQGYRVALDDFEYSTDSHPLLKLADVALSLRLLRYINSAYFGTRHEVSSIGQALALLGLENLRRCATLSIFAGVDDKPAELTVTALIRARFCELAGGRTTGADPSKLFAVGLFSVVDALLDTPIEEVLASIPFPRDMSRALIAHQGEMGALLDCVIALEAGDFDRAHSLLAAGADRYLEAIGWVNEVAAPLLEHVAPAGAG